MRVFSRIALAFLAAAVLAQPAFSQPQVASCPLTLMGTNPPASAFAQSPHGVFRSGSKVYVLRGQTLTTYNVTDLGDKSIAREDFITNLAGRNEIGGTAFSNGYLYVSSEAGLEVYNLNGGGAPVFVTRIQSVNYRRLTISGNTLAGLFPGSDMPCAPSINCTTSIDIFNITNPATLFRTMSLSSTNTSTGGFNDIAFNYNTLIATGPLGTIAYDLSQGIFRTLGLTQTPGTFLVSNGTNFLAVGNQMAIVTFGINNPFSIFNPLTYHSLATLQVGRANPIMFHPQAFIDDANARLITMVDEMDPERLQPARTIAFDVFDYAVPMIEGRDPRVYETVSYVQGDEVKYNPVAVGPVVYVVGETSGLQMYGSCGQMAGRIETDNVASLPCGGLAYVHGWVTGAMKITGVELFLDNATLGPATIGTIPRIDIPSKTPVFTWSVGVDFSQQSGLHTMRAIGTDANGNRRQFAIQQIFFPGPGQNCINRRRTAGH